jgi:hypothetical protein
MGKKFGLDGVLPTGTAPAFHPIELDRMNKINRMAANPGGEYFIL